MFFFNALSQLTWRCLVKVPFSHLPCSIRWQRLLKMILTGTWCRGQYPKGRIVYTQPQSAQIYRFKLIALPYPSNQASTNPCPQILMLLHPSLKQEDGLGNAYFLPSSKTPLIESTEKSNNTLCFPGRRRLRSSKNSKPSAPGSFLMDFQQGILIRMGQLSGRIISVKARLNELLYLAKQHLL